jgi:hypothetical protein
MAPLQALPQRRFRRCRAGQRRHGANYGVPYILKADEPGPGFLLRRNPTPQELPRAGLLNTGKWHALNRNYSGTSVVLGWGSNNFGETTVPAGLSAATAIAASLDNNLAPLERWDGRLVGAQCFWTSGQFPRACPASPPSL